MEINGYDNLAEAIIEQAVLDYKTNLLRIKQLTPQDEKEKPRTKNKCKKNIREAEMFFKSNWYDILAYLCDVKLPGKEIITAVKGNLENKGQKSPNGTDKN